MIESFTSQLGCQLGGRVVGEVKLSITRSWVQNLSLPDERSNRETSRRIGLQCLFSKSSRPTIYPVIFHIYRLTSAPLLELR